MNTLAIALVIALIIYAGRKWIRKYLHDFLPTGRPKIYHPLYISVYMRRAASIFPKLIGVGIILTITYVLTVVSAWVIYGLFNGWGPGEDTAREFISRSREHGPTFRSFLLSIPKSVFGSSVSSLNFALEGSSNIFLVVFILFLLHKSRKELNVSVRRFEIISYGLFLTVLIEVALGVFSFIIEGKSITNAIVRRLPIYSSYVTTVADLFAASFCEGIFLYVLFHYLDGKNARLKGALESAMELLPPLFIFNLFFHFLTHFPGHHGQISKSIAWLPAILVFLIPFIVSKDGASLKDAFKKNVRIVYRYPLDYLVLMVSLCLAAWFINYAFYLFYHFIYQPFFIKTNIPFTLWNTTHLVLKSAIFFWFSMFCFCVIGAFVQEISYKTYKLKDAPPNARL